MTQIRRRTFALFVTLLLSPVVVSTASAQIRLPEDYELRGIVEYIDEARSRESDEQILDTVLRIMDEMGLTRWLYSWWERPPATLDELITALESWLDDVPVTSPLPVTVEAEFLSASDSFFQPIGVSFGGKFVAPSNNDRLIQAGGGFTVGAEGQPLWVHADRTAYLAPIINMDVTGQRFNPNTQANKLGEPNQAANNFFSMALLPGARWHRGVTDRRNLFIQCGGLIGFTTTNLRGEPFDSRKVQEPVVDFTQDDWTFGFFVGGGTECQLPNDQIVRLGVNVESFSTDIVTGRGRQLPQISVFVEFVYPTEYFQEEIPGTFGLSRGMQSRSGF